MPPSLSWAPRCAALASRTTCTLSHSQAAPTTPSLTSISSRRLLSTTSPLLRTGYYAQGHPRDDPSVPIPKPSQKTPQIPVYPFGERQFYKQSNGGLYGDARIRFGNNVSRKNEIKTRRKWRPNVQRKRLWSAALGCFVQTRVTTRVLRTIDKVGGLDEYLLGDKTARIRELGPWGWKLRWRVMQTSSVRERYAAQRAALGLPPLEEGSGEIPVELVGEGVTRESLMEETQAMLDGESDFAIGEEAEAAPEAFMKEEPRPRN
ncbi:putative 54s ribosomal protein l24 protein [Phaeoacremonium minimum UCRPA7]|uniref:Large ribosomal subunit protein bL28m n=1 Tax=Phaeoacremonium minimum (strain UCR-PA7) TaxID=1286976 RepID=R8BLP3_PHAM7|nr:putative 54s ribosomal protein l24 protein [Phaeoacremonium minimum UCRPA7]EOO00296.1 putative 54s ribosomal protein l24 protein [Phaeoacremonium minimum UCRPA7]